MTGTVEVLIRKRDATETEADVLRTRIDSLILGPDWHIQIRYIEHREVQK